MKKLKYFLVFTGPLCGIFSLWWTGFWPWLLPIYAYVIIPILEFILPADTYNMSSSEEEQAKKDKFYDYLLYSLVPIQYGLVILFLLGITTQDLVWHELVGRVITLGIACVVLGINVAHELGHRAKKSERIMSKILLLSAQYMHFFIEHNKGHHKNVGTPSDPATARKGEDLYRFWARSITFSYLSAWRIEIKRLRSKQFRIISMHNRMIQFAFMQLAVMGCVWFVFDGGALLYYMLGCIVGILFFETVHYLEHYGLTRKLKENGSYERVESMHSWNSDHAIGRSLLFEVTRHADHHFMASRKYQILKSYGDAPQLPAGYPVMILCALVPPVWFSVMHRHMDKIKDQRRESGQPISSIA